MHNALMIVNAIRADHPGTPLKMTNQHERLRQARIAADFPSARQAAQRFGWAESTYAGHENGGRGFDSDQARIYARAFKVDEAWLLLGAPRLVQSNPQTPSDPPGFQDEAIPFGRTKSRAPLNTQLLRSIATSGGTLDQWIAATAMPEMGILKGDVLVLDLKADPTPGQIVIAQTIDPETSTSRAVVRQYWPPHLAWMPSSDDREFLRENDGKTNIVGTVAASYRPQK